MTNDRLIEILGIIIQCLEDNKPVEFSTGLCGLVLHLNFNKLISEYEMCKVMEILRRNKTTGSNRSYWWEIGNPVPRIQFLKKVIKQYE